MNFKSNLHWLIYPLFVLACARQTTPTGGPKDTIPPNLISSNPEHERINFTGKEIQLTFSEYVQAVNPKEQLIITPSLGKEYDITAKKNKVIISTQKELNDTTTYSINFRDAIQDITEKNPVRNLKLAFSTGPYIDSLSIEGRIFETLKGKPVADATVALYQQDTFEIFKHKPEYLTKTDKNGKYKLENLKNGKYHIYAMEDKNKNLQVDSRSENYGFLNDTINLNANKKNVAIGTVRLDARPLKLTSARPYNTYFNIKTSKNLARYKLTAPNNEIMISTFGEDNANIRVYNTINKNDSTVINFFASDSINNKIDTSFYVKFIDRSVTPEPFTVQTEAFQLIADKGTLTGTIKYNKPVLAINLDSIFFRIDSTRAIPFEIRDITIDSAKNRIYIKKTFDKKLLEKPEVKPDSTKTIRSSATSSTITKKQRAGIENELYLGKALLITIELDSSKQIVEKIRPLKLEDTGIILVEVKVKEKYFVVQLLDKNYNILKEVRNNKKFSFEDLPPGDYLLRLVNDRNNNGIWDAGNFYLKEEPEEIGYYRNEKGDPNINLKANWELGPLLITPE